MRSGKRANAPWWQSIETWGPFWNAPSIPLGGQFKIFAYEIEIFVYGIKKKKFCYGRQ